jgi:fido (protein-threonine AMPylation protein)
MNSLAENSLHIEYRLSEQAQASLRRWEEAMASEPPLQGVSWHLALERYLRSATVTASTQIEGNPLRLPEVDALLQGEHVETTRQARLEVLNYNAALGDATSLALTPSFEWAESTIRMFNHVILRELPGDQQGRYRTEPVTVGRFYQGPDHAAVPGLMGALVEWLAQPREHALVRVALLHLNIVAIHPWRDGNGRTARVLSSLELMRTGRVGAPELISIEPYLAEHRDEYFARLAETLGPTYAPDLHPATPWVEYFIEVSVGRLNFEDRVREAMPQDIGTIIQALERAGNPLEWGPVLHWAAVTPVRTRGVAELYGRSMSRARAWLGEMARAGWLERHGRTRGAIYEPTSRLRDLPLRVPALMEAHASGETLGPVA